MSHVTRTKFLTVSLIAAGIVNPVWAEDSDINIIGGFSYQQKTLEFTINPQLINFQQSSANFQIGAATRGFYVLYEMERPFSQYATILAPGNADNVFEYILEREDDTLTLGYNFWKSMNVFIGHKSGVTKIQFLPTVGSGEGYSFEYDDGGPFIGVSYSFDFGASGLLGVSVAYADMPTTFTLTELSGVGGVESTSGSTTGTSFGIKWTGPFTDQVDYSIGYKLSKYEFKDETLTSDNNNGNGWSTDQTYSTFYVGLSKLF
jgi:hypothetical protein